jgi:long-chain acyl-CoA synthetase
VNVTAVIRAHAQARPDLPALIEGKETLTYAALDRCIDAMTERLRASGVGPGNRVVLKMREGILHVVSAFAVMRLGAACCAVDWRSRPAEHQAIVESLSPRLVLVDRAAAAPVAGAPTLAPDAGWMEPRTAGAAPGDIEGGESPAILLLSSGTTGRPKATVISHRAAAWRGIIRRTNFAWPPGLRVLSAMPLSSSAGLSGLLGQIVAGATITFHPTLYSPEEIVEALRRLRTQHVSVVPTVLRWMLALPASEGFLLPDITSMLVLGAPCHPDEKRATLARITPHLYENYGSAGTGTICTATPQDIAARPDSVGRPPLFTDVAVVDAAGRPLAAGEVGRIRVRTPGAASGHFGDSARDEEHEAIRDGWVYPGDLGRLDGEGRLYLEGRAANLILRGGQNIHPEEIEQVLLAHPAVAEAAVVARADPVLGEVPVALVVLREPLPEAALAAHCRARLQPAKVPVAFHVVPSLPKTASGKVRRAALADLIGP